ncbi:MAG: hypothetical protein FWC45_05105 [Treponema sp.]|nr:hypothetical protein [Treponema sp.]
MVKTFSWYSPLEKTKRRIETFKGEVKAVRRNEQVDYSSLQTRISLVASAYPGKGFVSGFLTSFHHSTACSPAGLHFAGFRRVNCVTG